MKNDLEFVGIVSNESIHKTVSVDPWQPIAFDFPPYEVIKPFPSYMLTLGSGNASMATIAYGFQCVSAIDVFRHDFTSKNLFEPVVNVDHYIAGSISPNQFAVYKTPPQDYHWLKLEDKILSYVPHAWQPSLKNMLENGKH